MKNKVYTGIVLLLFIGVGLSIFVGQYPLRISDIINGDSVAVGVFFNLRLSRTIMAFLAGFGLSIAGYVYQTIFKNPIASPDIIGVSSGACAGAGIGIIFIGGGTLIVALCAFFGGMIAVLCAIVLAGLSGANRLSSFVLSGIAINALAQAVLMLLKMTADPFGELAALEFWTMGSLSATTLEKVVLIIPMVLLGSVALFLLYRHILLVSLSSDEARMLGVSLGRLRACVLILTTLVVGAIVSVSGLITFVGLIGPHITRLLTKSQSLKTMLFSGFLGSVILLFADVLARSIADTEIPISILTSLMGAPVLIWLVYKGRRVV